jgi:excinuclease ABC subunit C
MELKDKVKRLPSCPGVYLMKDSLGSIIYVGKSKNLKSRVGSYFQNTRSHSPKTVKLVKNIRDFDHIITDTEFEAFLLESRLIKEYKPAYNKLLKNPKSYSYIQIDTREEYPTIQVTLEPYEAEGIICFGPYTGRNTAGRALQGIKECCRIMCTGSAGRTSPCLNYSLGLCIGICQGSIPREQYLSIIDNIIKLLSGKDKSLLEEMHRNMNSAAEKLDFEKAARLRDHIRAVSSLIGKARVVEYTKENKNIAVLERLEDGGVKFFIIKGNKVLYSEKHQAGDHCAEELKQSIRSNIVEFLSTGNASASIEVTKEDIDESQIIYSYLNSRSKSCRHIVIPEKWLNTQNFNKLTNSVDKLLFALKT